MTFDSRIGWRCLSKTEVTNRNSLIEWGVSKSKGRQAIDTWRSEVILSLTRSKLQKVASTTMYPPSRQGRIPFAFERVIVDQKNVFDHETMIATAALSFVYSFFAGAIPGAEVPVFFNLATGVVLGLLLFSWSDDSRGGGPPGPSSSILRSPVDFWQLEMKPCNPQLSN